MNRAHAHWILPSPNAFIAFAGTVVFTVFAPVPWWWKLLLWIWLAKQSHMIETPES
jgi:hypothetical protein